MHKMQALLPSGHIVPNNWKTSTHTWMSNTHISSSRGRKRQTTKSAFWMSWWRRWNLQDYGVQEHVHSLYHPRVKSGTIRCPARRAEKVCDDTEKEKEMLHLHETFKRNGYPEQVISRNLKPNPRTQTTQDKIARTKKPPTLFLPYVATRPVREDTNSK